ncbi:MAG: transporter [Desulfobacteraceae bacterium]|nr:transporter [Desulfobacteraceae bacterium]
MAMSLMALWAMAIGFSNARAQEIEPRGYTNAPVGVNFLIVGYAYSKGALSSDPSLPLTDPELETSNAVLAYARALDLWGKSGKFDLVLPYTWLSGTAELDSQPIERNVDGIGDCKVRIAVNLYGSPALRLKEFANYKQDLIVGVSLQVTAPTGQYDDSRLINISSHRWAFKPEVGISKAVGAWTMELAAAATLFTDNNDFYGGHTRSQEPLYAIQGHVIYSFRPSLWASVDATHFTGGQTAADGEYNDDLQQNWRMGATLALPVDRHNSIKLYASSGVSARTGNNYDLFGLAWQYRWDGGL